MQRYAALWLFPIVSLVLVVYMTFRGGEVVDAPDEAPAMTPTDIATLDERNTNLSESLARSAAARTELQRHVVALHDELVEMRASRTALLAEAELWRDSYGVLAARFDDLAALSRAEYVEAIDRSNPMAIPARFTSAGEAVVPTPSSAVIVR